MSKRTITKTTAPYRLKKHGQSGIWYAVDKKTRKATSLKCKGTRQQAEEIANIQFGNTDDNNAVHHMKSAEAHLAKCNPEWTVNTWDMIAQRMIHGPRMRHGGAKKKTTLRTHVTCWNNKRWDGIRDKRAIDTMPSDFGMAVKDAGIAHVEFGKQLHSYAMGHRLIPYAIMGKEMWPKHRRSPKSRPVEWGEHNQLVEYMSVLDRRSYSNFATHHPDTTARQWRDEWVAFLWLLWWTGASQGDAANLNAENIIWSEGVLEFKRCKWVNPDELAPCRVAITKGGQLEALLKSLPKKGELFPLLKRIGTSNRSRPFMCAAKALGLEKISLHGYRFGWAIRAKEGGMDVQDRMASLGHNTMLMADHYSKNAKIKPASIEIIDGGLKAA